MDLAAPEDPEASALGVIAMKVFTLLEKRWLSVVFFVASLVPLAVTLLSRVGSFVDARVRIERPLVAFVAPLAMAFVAFRLARIPRRSSRLRGALTELLTLATVLALSLAAAGVEIGRELDRLTVIVVVDRSRSIDLVPNAEELVTKQLSTLTTSMHEEDRVATVVFGATATTEDPPRTKREKPTAQRMGVGRDGSDIEAAIRRALAEVPTDSAARIILMTDGVATRGDTMAAASAALAAGVPIDFVLLEQRGEPDVRVVSVSAPPRGAEGEAIDLRVVTSAPADTEVNLIVRRDGQIISRATTTIRGGEDVLRIREKLVDGGFHRYEVEVSPTDPKADFSSDDNSGSAFVRVRGQASALILEGDEGKSAFVANALRNAAFRVVEGGETSVPKDLAGFAAYDLVVLSDIAAPKLSQGQIEGLASYVRDFGGGLLLLGGDRSFGPGGFGKTPIEEISPVSFDIKNEERRASLAEVIGIDISGSMAASVGDKTKLELANEAAARSAELLGVGDLLGVEHVDTVVHWSVPLGPITDKAMIDHAIRAVDVGGGGIIVPITLAAGYEALDHIAHTGKVNLKHLLLFADGNDAEEIDSALPLATPARARGITTSVVALGTGKDLANLEELSKLGGGRFYLIEDATRLPAVFAQETILASRSALVEESFHVAVSASSAATRGIDFGEAPTLGGYVVTIAKSRASVLLTGPESDPILATWSVGVGRAAAFTSDLKDRWGAQWTGWPGAARMVAETARDVARKGEDGRVRLESDARGGEMHLRATVVGDDGRSETFKRLSVQIGGPDGSVREAPLEATGAGLYASDIPLSRQGTYITIVKDAETGEVLGTTGAVLSAGEELRPTGSDIGLLRRVATFTRGKRRDTLDTVFRDRVSARLGYEDESRWLALLSALGLVAFVAARKLALPPIVAPLLQRLRHALGALRRVPNVATSPAELTVSTLLRARTERRSARAREPVPAAVSDSPAVDLAATQSAASRSPSTPSARVEPPAEKSEALTHIGDNGKKLSTAEILLARKRRK